MTSYPRLASISLFAAIGLVSTVVNVEARQAAPKTTPVTIVGPLPVPVTGSITDPDHPARHPFQVTLCRWQEIIGGIFGCGQTPDSFSVPADRVAVVEYISGRCGVQQMDALELRVETTAGQVVANHDIHLQSPVFNGSNSSLQAAQLVRIYADPGSVIGMTTSGSGFGGFACFVTLSGHYVAP